MDKRQRYHGYLALLTRSCADRVFIIPSFLAIRWQCTNIDDSGWQYPKVKFSACKWLLMPVHLNNNHWALLVAEVNAQTVGIVNTMPSHDTHIVEQFMQYMTDRAAVTGELASWTERTYDIARQRDGSSCGVLALMAAEAIINDVLLSGIDVTAVAFYRRYIKSRLLLNSRGYDDPCRRRV